MTKRSPVVIALALGTCGSGLLSLYSLRAYKAKFATEWEPRHIVYRHARQDAGYGVAT